MKEKKPQISLITVSYNSSETIEKTIKSVINQTYDNIEYIIIDGGSTDGTVDIIKKYKDKIDYWVSETDKNNFDAMNKGIKASSGDAIFILNADDILYDRKIIENVAKRFEKDLSLEIIYGNIVKYYPEHNIAIRAGRNEKNPKIYKNTPPHQGTFIKKQLINKIGLFDIQFNCSADTDLLIRCFKTNPETLNIEKDIAIFRMGGISSNKEVSWREGLKVTKKHFGYKTFLGAYIRNIILEKNIKKILKSLGLLEYYYRYILTKFNKKNIVHEIKQKIQN